MCIRFAIRINERFLVGDNHVLLLFNAQWVKIVKYFRYLYFLFAFFYRGFIGVVSQPSTFSSLELGYVCTPNGRCLPVQEVDLPLWQHGEGGQDPKDFAFRFVIISFFCLFRIFPNFSLFSDLKWKTNGIICR